MSGRENNAIVLQRDKTILITTDILEADKDVPSIMLDSENDLVDIVAKDIFIESSDGITEDQSIVYGQRLNELLKFILETLMSHSHPPNNVPINTFFTEARKWINEMDEYLLNKHVKTR